MKYFLFLFFTLISVYLFGASLYSKAFGPPEDPAIIFLHGGPGYNCASFEITTAEKLSKEGFYVIVYDRSGEGRSMHPKTKYNFKNSFKDIQFLYKKYDINKASLIGHSFGGVLGTKFAVKFPKMVEALILVGAPISLQESFSTVISTSRTIYLVKEDYTNLNYLDLLDEMDKTTLQYAVYCFSHAMQNGFYSPQKLSEEAQAIYANFKTDSTLIQYGSAMTTEATKGFWKNEAYTTIDLTESLRLLHAKNLPLFGLYGKEDGLYSTDQINQLDTLIGKDRLKHIENCSHSVFIDQQQLFISSLKEWLLN